jgi:hypothetical protein
VIATTTNSFVAARIPIIPLASYRSGRKFPLPCSEIGYEALILFAPWCRYGGSDVCFRMNHDRLRPDRQDICDAV